MSELDAGPYWGNSTVTQPFPEVVGQRARQFQQQVGMDPLMLIGWNTRQGEVDKLRAENQRLRELVLLLLDPLE